MARRSRSYGRFPVVGENYANHHLLIYSDRTSLAPDEIVDGLVAARVDPADLSKNSDKVLGWNSMVIIGKYKFNERDVVALGPAF